MADIIKRLPTELRDYIESFIYGDIVYHNCDLCDCCGISFAFVDEPIYRICDTGLIPFTAQPVKNQDPRNQFWTKVGSKQSKHRSREDSYTLNSDMDQQLSHPEALEKPHVVELKPEEEKKTTLKKIRNFLLQSELEIKIGPPLPPKLHLDPAARKFFNGSASSVDLASHSESSSLSTAQVARRDRVQWGMSYSGSGIEFARVDSDGGRSNFHMNFLT
eukprot:g40828.t1